MNQLYPRGKAEVARQNLNVLTADLRAVLVDTDVYTYDDAHEFYTSLSGIVGPPSAQLTNPTISDDGIFDADPTVLSSVSGSEAEALVIYVNTGTPANDLLLAYIDTATGLPVIPNGTNINITWNVLGIWKW